MDSIQGQLHLCILKKTSRSPNTDADNYETNYKQNIVTKKDYDAVINENLQNPGIIKYFLW